MRKIRLSKLKGFNHLIIWSRYFMDCMSNCKLLILHFSWELYSKNSRHICEIIMACIMKMFTFPIKSLIGFTHPHMQTHANTSAMDTLKQTFIVCYLHRATVSENTKTWNVPTLSVKKSLAIPFLSSPLPNVQCWHGEHSII